MKALRDKIEDVPLVDPRETKSTKPPEEVVPIPIHSNYPDCHVMIKSKLTKELQNALVGFLKKYYNVFAGWYGNILGIDPHIVVHKLFTDSDHSPVNQKRKKFTLEQLKVIEEKVAKLIKAGAIREFHYPDWLANIVVAP